MKDIEQGKSIYKIDDEYVYCRDIFIDPIYKSKITLETKWKKGKNTMFQSSIDKFDIEKVPNEDK